MAPNKISAPPYSKGEKVLCFHHEMLYDATILEIQQAEDLTTQYKIHYKGWKKTWDDWVPQDRIRKYNEENRELAQQLVHQARASQQSAKPAKKVVLKGGSDFSSARGSEERTGGPAALSGRGGPARRARDYDMEHEESFHNRPSIKLVLSDHLKGFLVDDWENVTKNNHIVELPHKKATVEKILQNYIDFEKQQRTEGSTERDILEETTEGIREYFDKALPRILLYKFEREQWKDISADWEKEPNTNQRPSCIYGAEHLCRLLVSLPELIAQTNMDAQSISRLREELAKFTNWLSKNYSDYFLDEYISPGAEYLEKARA